MRAGGYIWGYDWRRGSWEGDCPEPRAQSPQSGQSQGTVVSLGRLEWWALHCDFHVFDQSGPTQNLFSVAVQAFLTVVTHMCEAQISSSRWAGQRGFWNHMG